MIELILLATTDLHATLRAYDYYKDEPVDHYGLAKVATLVEQERAANPHALLVDAGDFFQGSALGDLYGKGNSPSANPRAQGKATAKRLSKHPVMSAFEALNYDAVAIGNHEFDFGLSALRGAMSGTEGLFTSANIWLKDSGFAKWSPLAATSIRALRNVGGVDVATCFFGLTPPQILVWNKAKLEGRVRVDDGFTTAKRTSRELKASGKCDVVVAIVHGGINPLPLAENDENPAWHVAALPDVDAVVAGHAHQEFPSAKFEGLKGADVIKGLVNGKPLVMAGQWGSHLGVIKISLEKGPQGLRVVGGTAALRSTKGVAEQPNFVSKVEQAHASTLADIRKPVGKLRFPVDTYFSRIASNAAVDVVNDAQLWYAQKAHKAEGTKGSPFLSAAAPFKAGYKGEYTSIPAGTVAVKHIADLYVYPNTLQAVELTGAQVKDWLEKSAEAFHLIDPGENSDRPLLDDAFPSYNFDVLAGLTYAIDVTKPKGARIVALKREGKPLDPAAKFRVLTNNYRASGGGKFPHLGGSKVVWDAAVENRQVLLEYVREQSRSRGIVNAKAAHGWALARVENVKGRVWVDAPSKASPPAFLQAWPEATGVPEGNTRYIVDFSKLPSASR
ncbi:MAG: bifunctional 2',3'-cyclic-nucleotide 2'-phosphodiesterase/3'-nucleotidase [Silvanigrellales bacterium]|nr:bifunctional 2',3'-cyclic-nucleotide 2'-phosphodiesterase/3'-nucleotidase [Silvanigrellales bacterium]